MKGVYQHCGKQHLHRYVAEFEFRYNNRSALGVEDHDRAKAALTGAKGKRLYYTQSARARAAAADARWLTGRSRRRAVAFDREKFKNLVHYRDPPSGGSATGSARPSSTRFCGFQRPVLCARWKAP